MADLAQPDVIEEVDLKEMIQASNPWTVIVSNDPVNLIDVVAGVFQRVLEIPPEVAMEYTMKVHKEGRCAVFWGGEDECKLKAEQLMAYSLWVHVEKTGN